MQGVPLYEQTLTPRELFLHRALKKTEFVDGHWLWTGCFVGPYGNMRWKKKTQLIHRLSYAFFYRCVPPKHMEVHHLCRVKACWNPDHLKLDTRKEHRDDEKEDRRFCPTGHDRWLVGTTTNGSCLECKRNYGKAFMRRKRESSN